MGENCIILIPTYNERLNVRIIVPEIFSILPKVSVMIIDDSSPDGTGKEVRDLIKIYPRLELYSRNKKEGLGKAYLDAFRKVLPRKNIHLIIMMDADGSHATEYLPTLIKKLSGVDVVIGSRYIKGGGIEKWEIWRRYLSKWGNLYARSMVGIHVKDLTAGFIGIQSSALSRINLNNISASGYAFLMDLKFHLANLPHIKIEEMPIIFRNRHEGESKISRHVITEGLFTPLRLFLKRFTKNH